jgi:hypothetical protein
MTDDKLAIYLNDHLAGATGGVELARRLADAHPSGDWAPRLRLVANDIAEDRAALLTIMQRLDITVDQIKVALGWLGEKVARLKLNGRLFRRSPLSDVIELEGMRLGVEAKAAGWRTLTVVAQHDERLPIGELEGLLSRASAQIELLEELRVEAAKQVFGAPTPPTP